MMDKYQLRKQYVNKIQFSYSLLGIAIVTWTLQPPDINLDLATYPKDITPLMRLSRPIGQHAVNSTAIMRKSSLTGQRDERE